MTGPARTRLVLFDQNPRRHEFDLDDEVLTRLCRHACARFATLPVLHRGESSEIRRTTHPGILAQRLIPSLNSITSRRKGTVPGSEQLRLDISTLLWKALHAQGLPTAHLARNGSCLLLSAERIPPVEVVVKAALTGTPSRIYHGLAGSTDRFGQRFDAERPHDPYVRFDYRNPLVDAAGELLRDECLPLALADRLIDTRQATRSALDAFGVVQAVLGRAQLDVLDACFIFDEAGRVLSYELSPDNMRIKNLRIKPAGQSHGLGPDADFDKDLWRAGHDGDRLLAQWSELLVRLRRLDV